MVMVGYGYTMADGVWLVDVDGIVWLVNHD